MFGLTTILWCIYPRAMGSFILKQVNLKCIFYFNTQSYLHISYLCSKGDQNSMVSTVTCYRLDVLGFKCWWGQDFLDPPSLLYKGYQVSFLKMKWQGCGADHPPLLVLSSCIQTVHTHCKELATVPPYSCVPGLLLLYPPLGAADFCLDISPRNLEKYSHQDVPLKN